MKNYDSSKFDLKRPLHQSEDFSSDEQSLDEHAQHRSVFNGQIIKASFERPPDPDEHKEIVLEIPTARSNPDSPKSEAGIVPQMHPSLILETVGSPTDTVKKIRMLNRYFGQNATKLIYGESVNILADRLKYSEETLTIIQQEDEQSKSDNMNPDPQRKETARTDLQKAKYALGFHDYVTGNLKYSRMFSPAGDEVNSGNMVFQIVPFMLFNSRKRVEQQIERITKYTMKMISSRRIDDQDSIKKNIANLKLQIESNIQKVKNASQQTVKYGDKVMLVHFTSGLFLRVESRQKEKLSVNQLSQSFKPFRLTVTHLPDSQCLFEFVPVYRHKLGHSIKLDQPCRLGYVHERPVEKEYVLDAEFGHQEAIMFSEEACGSLRLSQPLPQLMKQLPSSIRSFHGSTLLILNKESQRYLTLTVKTNQERIFQRFKDIKKKVMDKQLKEMAATHSGLAHGLDLMLEFKNIQSKSTFRRKSRATFYRDITEKLTYRGGNNYNLTFTKQNQGIFRAPTVMWQVVFDDQGFNQREDTYIVRVWLKHIMYNTVIGPLLMHVTQETSKSNITVKFQTVGMAGKYINIDGEFSQKTQQFQFTKLVSLKSYSGKKTPTEQMTLIKAESEDIKISLFLSSVNMKLERVRALDDDWDHQIVEMLEKLIIELQRFILNERVDMIDKRVPLNAISTLHQDIVRDAHVIKYILDLFEHMNRRIGALQLPKDLLGKDDDELTSQGEYLLNGMLRQIIELLRVFIKNNQENIRITIIYFIPRLIIRNHFKMFPVLILRIIQQVLGHITADLFQTVQKSILLFLRNLVSIAISEETVYSNMNKKARIELFITLKTYARMLNLNHNEDLIKSYFYSFIMDDSNYQCIMQKFHKFYTGPDEQVEEAKINLMGTIGEINCPKLIQEELYVYTEIYKVFLNDETPKRKRIADLVREIQRDKGSFIDPYMPILSGLLRIIRHTFQDYHSFIMYQPALLRIESDFGVVQRQNQISSKQMIEDLQKMTDFQTILRFDSFELFKCLKYSVHSFITNKQKKRQSFFREISESGPECQIQMTPYHIEMMRMYNSILLQPGVLSEKRRMQFLSDTLAGYLEVCYEWVTAMKMGSMNPYEQKIRFPRISSLQLQILRMQVETQFAELKTLNKDMRFLTSGMESVRNYLNQIEMCYESQTAKRIMKFEESNLKQLRRTLTRKEGEDTFRQAATGRNSSKVKQRQIVKIHEEAWDQVVNFLSIVVDIDQDVFLDAYVSQARGVQDESEIEPFITNNICQLLENPRAQFSLINKYDRLAVILEALLSWLPFIQDTLILRKTLSFITRITNLKIELRNLMCNSTFLSYKTLQPQSLQQIQDVEENLLEVDKLTNSSVSHWRHFLRETIQGGEGSIKGRTTVRVHSQDLAKHEVMEKLLSLLQKIDGFFSLFLPFRTHRKADICAINNESITQEDLNLASKIFRVIHGHQVIIRLATTMQDLLSQALQCYSPNTLYVQKDVDQAKQVAATVPQVFSWAYRILSKFAKYNIENKEIMIHHISDLLPAYGAMFQIALFYSDHNELSLLHEAFVELNISVFSMNERLVYYPIIVHDFMVKLNLRVVFEKFSVMSRIYAEILQNSSDPMLFDLAVNQLKVIKRNLDESCKVMRKRHVRNRKVLHPQTLKWPEIRESLHKMKTNLQSDAFKTIRMKIEDFYLVLKSDIVMGITGREISKLESSRDISSFVLKQLHTPSKLPNLQQLQTKGRISVEHQAQSQGEEDLSLIEPNHDLEFHQSLEEKMSHHIKVNPELEALIRAEKSLMHYIIFEDYRPSSGKCSCGRRKRDKDTLLQLHKRTLTRFFRLRNNRPQILHAKLLFYIEHLIKILKVDHIFDVSNTESVRLQVLEIYFIYKQSNRVAKILEARVIEMISYFFTNRNSVKLMSILPLLLEFANFMLNEGSKFVQNRFYEFFNEIRDINVFSHINALIRRQIYNIETQRLLLLKNARFAKERDSKKLVLKDPANQSIFFLKSLCENHHVAFQLFMTDQGYEKNYDMIDLSVDFLYSLLTLIYKTYYNNAKVKLSKQIQHILDFVRTAKHSSSRFSINYQPAVQEAEVPMSQYLSLSRSKKSQKKRMAKFIQQNFNRELTKIPHLSLVCDNIITTLNAIIEYVQGPCLVNQKRIMISSFMQCAEMIFRQFHFTFSEDSLLKVEIKNLQLLMMKSHCALILRSMVEGRGQDDYLSKAIKTEITIRDVEYLIAYTYYAFLRLNSGVFILDQQYFGNPGTPNWYTLEAGFNFYFLMRSFFDSEQNLEKAQLDRVYSLIELEDRRRSEKGVCRQVYEFFRDIFNCKKQSFVYQNFLPPLEMLSKHRFLRFYNTYFKDAIEFYKRNSASIEILKNDRLETIYFPKAPSYHKIPKNQKESLIFNLSTDTDSVKVDSIMKKGTYLIQSMSRRFYFQNFFLKWPLLGLFFARSELWNIFAFWLGMIINVIIFFSFTTTNSPDPHKSGRASFLITLVGDAPNQQALGPSSVVEPATDWLLDILGVTICFFIVFGNLLLIFQKFAMHIEESKRKKYNSCLWCQRRHKGCLGCLKFLSIIWGCLTDYIFLYTIAYLVFAFLGVFVDYFYYAFLLTSIFRRSPQLQNILKAIWRPRKELLYTLIIFLLAEYVFALIIFEFYQSQIANRHCISLTTCFFTVIDQTFKNDGGIGGYLDGQANLISLNKSADYPGRRLILAQAFNFIMLILIIQVFAAILIDTFGDMRNEKNKIEELVNSTCLICGKERDEIEREGEDFTKHVKYRHNMFNYILFIAYLKKKNPIDYTGIESYVYDRYNHQRLDWFPIYKYKGTT